MHPRDQSTGQGTGAKYPVAKKWLTVFFLILAITGVSQAPVKKDNTALSESKFKISLSLTEFSILNGSMVDGLTAYQGNLEFTLNMSTEGNQVVYELSSSNKKLFEVLSLYVAQKSVELLKLVDINNPSANDKVALGAVSSLSGKLDAALKDPAWENRKVSGLVGKSGDTLRLAANGALLTVTGNKTRELEPFVGKQVILNGYIKEPGKLEMVNVHERKPNTLELFVMSQCPFGANAIAFVLGKREQLPAAGKFNLEIRYIFYQKDGRFSSLHGDGEITEDLVQMVIRDRFNPFFVDYLKQRIKDPKSDWKELARNVKMKESAISQVKVIVETNQADLIQKEYQYATDNFQHVDASPTYAWESEVILNPNDIEILKGSKVLETEKCKTP